MSDNKSVDAVNKANQITGFQLFAMTTSMVMTVYGFAAFAQQGPTALFFLFLASILWFVPVTRTSGEMASINGWSKGGRFHLDSPHAWGTSRMVSIILSMGTYYSWYVYNDVFHHRMSFNYI